MAGWGNWEVHGFFRGRWQYSGTGQWVMVAHFEYTKSHRIADLNIIMMVSSSQTNHWPCWPHSTSPGHILSRKGNESAALGQRLSSTSMDTRNSVFKFFKMSAFFIHEKDHLRQHSRNQRSSSKLPGTRLEVAQLVKNLHAVQKTQVWFLGQEDPLEKGWATHSYIHGLPWWLRW